MDIQFFTVFHKILYKKAYEELSKEEFEKYITPYAVNYTKYPEKDMQISSTKLLREDSLEYYSPSLQESYFCESSCLFHLYFNKSIIDKYSHICVIQYDMSIDKTVIPLILNTTLTDRTVFYHCKHVAYEHLNQYIGLQTWSHIVDEYNKIYNTSFTLMDILHKEIILYHCFLISKPLFSRMIELAIKVVPIIVEKLNGELKHFPSHIERFYGVFLLLEQLRNVIDEPIHMKGISHNHEQFKLKWN